MPHKLLLADDSVTIQRVIELTFAEEDVRVVAVSDGDQAIASLDADPPDIVLADIGMPGRDGYQVAEYIKASPRLAHIPVVLLTGAFEPVDQARAAAIGCDGVLAKPFEPQLVISRVKELLARPAQAAAPVSRGQAPAEQAVWGSPAAAPAAQTAGPEGLEDYFDRLDAAFANLSAPAGAAPAAASIDWFDTKPSGPPSVPDRWDSSVTTEPAAPEPAALAPSLVPVPSMPAPPTIPAPPEVASMLPPPPPATSMSSTESEPPSRPQMPALADAFAALLAAEQTVASAPSPAGWPAAPAAPEITDGVIDEVVRRVVDKLSDQVVRELASQTIATVAERLVREEIERIKASVA